MTTKPFQLLPADADAAAIGHAVCEALAMSHIGEPDPADWKAAMRPFYDMVGVKTWGQFARGTLLCRMEQNGDKLTALPYENRNQGRQGFVPCHDRKLTASWPLPKDEVGQLVVKALERCG